MNIKQLSSPGTLTNERVKLLNTRTKGRLNTIVSGSTASGMGMTTISSLKEKRDHFALARTTGYRS